MKSVAAELNRLAAEINEMRKEQSSGSRRPVSSASTSAKDAEDNGVVLLSSSSSEPTQHRDGAITEMEASQERAVAQRPESLLRSQDTLRQSQQQEEQVQTLQPQQRQLPQTLLQQELEQASQPEGQQGASMPANAYQAYMYPYA